MNIAAIVFPCVLGLSVLLAAILAGRARPASRDYLRFAAMLYLALALSQLLAGIFPGDIAQSLARAITFLACALAPAALALALFATFEHPPSAFVAAVLLMIACIAGIAAAMSDTALLFFAPLMASVFVMLALSMRQLRLKNPGALYAIVSAICLIGSAATSMKDGANGQTGLALFSAAGLLGIALALTRSRIPVIEERGRDMRLASIGPKR